MSSNKFKNVMIDIETFGTKKDSVVLSIAVTPFNEKEISEKSYYHTLPIESQLKLGRKISQDTWNWWSEQSLNPITKPSIGDDLKPYLIELSSFIYDLMEGSNDEFRVWSNPPQFDIDILEDLYEKVNLKPVWDHYNQCDVRTVKKVLGKSRYEDIVNKSAHNPIEDNIYQIKIVQKFLSIINND
jgi:hypothetical protein